MTSIGRRSVVIGGMVEGVTPSRFAFFGLTAIFVLRIVHAIGFCGLHSFADAEIRNVVFDVNWNKLSSSVPTHKSFEMSHFLANFAVHWNHETTIGSQEELLMSSTRFLQHCA